MLVCEDSKIRVLLMGSERSLFPLRYNANFNFVSEHEHGGTVSSDTRSPPSISAYLLDVTRQEKCCPHRSYSSSPAQQNRVRSRHGRRHVRDAGPDEYVRHGQSEPALMT